MFVVEVEVVKQWTDRGGQDWVTVYAMAGSDDPPVEVDVKPEDLHRLERSLIEVPHSGSWD